MPACFQLIPKGTTEPEPLAKIDEKICAHLGVEVHPVHYAEGWYDTIGFQLAIGIELDSEKMRERVQRDTDIFPRLPEVLEFLVVNYQSKAWRE